MLMSACSLRDESGFTVWDLLYGMTKGVIAALVCCFKSDTQHVAGVDFQESVSCRRVEENN